MIRDQFKDVKKVTGKEERKKAQMGARNYFAKRASSLTDLNKGLGISLVISVIMIALAYALVLLMFIVSRGTETEYELWKFIVWSCVFGLCVIFLLVWFLIWKPANVREIARCKRELEILNAEALMKASAVYAMYGEEYKREQERKNAEAREKAKREAEEKAKLEAQAKAVENTEKTEITGENKAKIPPAQNADGENAEKGEGGQN